jgi:hypothetical protein
MLLNHQPSTFIHRVARRAAARTSCLFNYPGGAPSFPLGRPVYPESKTDSEATGLKPDVACPAADALKTAHLRALTRKLERDPAQKDQLAPIIERITAQLQHP